MIAHLSFTTKCLLSTLLFVVSYAVFLTGKQFSKLYKTSKQQDDISGSAASERHWLFGHLLSFALGSQKGLMKQADTPSKFPIMFNFWLSPVYSLLHLWHPDSAGPVLKSNTSVTSKNLLQHRLIRQWVGRGLITSDGDHWLRHRRMLTPAFHFQMLRNYVEKFNGSAKVLVKKWQDTVHHNTPLDVFKPVSLAAMDTLLKCAMSVESNCQVAVPGEPTYNYVKAVDDMEELLITRVKNPFLHADWIFNLTATGKKWKEGLAIIHGYAEKVIADRKRERSQSADYTCENRDFLDVVLSARDDEGKELSDKDIRDEVDTFLAAGHDTTASAISWALHNLGNYPSYQKKCREEIENVVGDKEDIEWNDISKLEFLTMFIKESMRLFPPVYSTGRTIEKNIDIVSDYHSKNASSVLIPKGSSVQVNMFAMHRSEVLWKDPKTFDPERFTAANRKNIPPLAYIPFSAGSRNCLGQQFAMNEIKVVVGQLLRKFEFYTDSDVPETIMKPTIILKGESGIFVKFRPVE